MNAKTLTLCVATLAFSAGAFATGVRAVDVPRISNGSTGFIGVTASANTPLPMFVRQDSNFQRFPAQAGEATTMVDGRPNANPDAWASRAAQDTWAMGAGAAVNGPSASPGRAHPGWGTPD